LSHRFSRPSDCDIYGFLLNLRCGSEVERLWGNGWESAHRWVYRYFSRLNHSDLNYQIRL
jgi:hypothetical protein